MKSELTLTEEFRVKYETLFNAKADDFKRIAKEVKLKLIPNYNIHFKIKPEVEVKLKEDEKLLRRTKSVCPECQAILNAVVFERDGKVWIRKVCPEHGEFEEIYWSDAQLYKRFSKWNARGPAIEANVPQQSPCPYNCGLCVIHESHTALMNLVATNRCDLSCWYCFFYDRAAGYVYEPTLEHIKYLLEVMRNCRPIPVKAIQITGGEPLLRDDIVQMIRLIKSYGITHVQVNTTGIKLVFEPKLAVELREAGTNVLYLSFDGVSPNTNPKNHWEIPYILRSLREAKLGVVLVPTLIKNYNFTELGDIVNFALKHMDIVRGVNIQPVSLTGRMPREEREKFRVTIPDVLIEIEKSTEGQIGREDWYPVPTVAPISHFIEALTGKPQYVLTAHFACGAATYVFKDGDKLIPITRFIDVEGLMGYLEDKAQEIRRARFKKLKILSLLRGLNKFIDWSKVPSYLRSRRELLKLIRDIFIRHDYSSLGEFHYKTLFLGTMHFQDLYNYDISRVRKCVIHYISPDGRIIPFCAFNVLTTLYREKVQKVFGIPIRKWEKITGMRVADYKYRRPLRKLLDNELYRKTYEGIFDPSSLPYNEHVEISKRFGIPVVE